MEIVGDGNCPFPGLCGPGGVPLYDATILGMVQEFGGGFSTARTLLHNGLDKSTIYVPE